MTPGDVVLAHLPSVGGSAKLRPALYLAELPGPYQEVLVCGISSQWHNILLGWDETLEPGDIDFVSSGLRLASVIRLSYLDALKANEIAGVVGQIDASRLARLRQRLSDHVRP